MPPRRAVLAACALVLMGCAHKLNQPDHPAIASTAQFIIQALAPRESEGAGGDYRWNAFLERVSNTGHWRSSRRSDADVRRDGRLNSGVGVVAAGDSEHVAMVTIDTNAFYAV